MNRHATKLTAMTAAAVLGLAAMSLSTSAAAGGAHRHGYFAGQHHARHAVPQRHVARRPVRRAYGRGFRQGYRQGVRQQRRWRNARRFRASPAILRPAVRPVVRPVLPGYVLRPSATAVNVWFDGIGVSYVGW